MASLIIDLVLLGIVALCGWRGFRTGIINGVSWIIALVIAVYGANIVANAYYSEFSGMLQPFAVGLVDTVLRGGDQEDGESDGTVIDQDITVDEMEKLDVYTVSKAVLRRLGIADSAAESIAADTAKDNSVVNSAMSMELTVLLCNRASFVAIFAIAFALIAIVFTVIGNVFDISFGLPGHENLNHITGAALGVIRGLMIVLVIGCLARYVGIVIPGNVMSRTFILRRVVETNKLAELLKI